MLRCRGWCQIRNVSLWKATQVYKFSIKCIGMSNIFTLENIWIKASRQPYKIIQFQKEEEVISICIDNDNFLLIMTISEYEVYKINFKTPLRWVDLQKLLTFRIWQLSKVIMNIFFQTLDQTVHEKSFHCWNELPFIYILWLAMKNYSTLHFIFLK